jgi:ABC-type antimicrobial peptide transport system permease subunit
MPALTVLMRTDAEPLDQAPVLREAVRRVDPALALFEMTSGERALASSLEERRFTLLLLFAFAAVAMTLAAVGIYGVVSYAVSERTREMGVRIALGAEPRQVFRLVVGHGLRLSTLAIAVGLGLALMAGRVMEGMLFGVQARDPLTFALVGTLLLVTAFAACALPARRATRTDPVTALRSE